MVSAQDESAHGMQNVHYLCLPCAIADNYPPSCLQLTKDDEATAGDEVEVRREDQDKINKFSRLHQRQLNFEEDLKSKNVRTAASHDDYDHDHNHNHNHNPPQHQPDANRLLGHLERERGA